MRTVAKWDKMRSNREATVTKRALNMAERDKTYKVNKMPGIVWASRPTTDHLQVLLRPITDCHVLLRSPRFTTAYWVSHLHRDCRGKFFDSLKIWHGIHGNYGLSRVPIRSPALCHVNPVSSTVAWNVVTVARREHSVNVALDNPPICRLQKFHKIGDIQL